MGINVLSLFDGMSCGQIALNRAGIAYDNYFASEIDKYAIAVTQHNYPDTIQIGDVTKINTGGLPRIDLLIGGSPCQGFSFAGKGLNFNDPRSKLFFEFVRLLKECGPKYFLLENVKMKKEYQDIISEYLGVDPVEINSSLVSAQNRKRLYWTNISNITQPKDKGILLKEIVQENSVCLGLAQRGRYKNDGGTAQKYELNGEEKSNALTTVGKDSLVFIINPSGRGMNGRVIKVNRPKSFALTTNKGKGQKIMIEGGIRKFTPIECERLQTVPDNYTSCVSNFQRYKMLGNGWTVDVIAHIFKGITQES